MGGATYTNGHSCARSSFRGTPCCAGSVKPYQETAVAVGQAILLDPINGSWSNLSASGNTHAGGGACDFEGDGYTASEVYDIARRARDKGLLAYPRLWRGNWHVHTEDPRCHTLSAAAQAQFALFARGLDALVGNGPDPLKGYKRDEIMALFNARNATTAPSAPSAPSSPAMSAPGGVYTIRSGDTLGKVAAAFKVTVANLVSWNKIQNPNVVFVGQKVRVTAPPASKVNPLKPTGSFPYPNRGCYYGPSSASSPRWYSGKVGSPIRSVTSIRNEIKRIQRMVGAYADGRYGPETVRKVKAWQKSHKRTADGIVGPGTWAAMVAANR